MRAPDNLVVEHDLATACAEADFVQESAPEDLELKRTLLADIDAVTPPDVVISSSTSGYGMSEMQVQCVHPERTVVGHPFNPPYLIPLVEVVGGTATVADVVAWTSDFFPHAGKSVITMDHEVPGFVANRLQEALWREALHMVAGGEATVEQIDHSITDGPGLRWPIDGPMLTFHLAGGQGGMAHMLDHFGPSLLEPWTRLEAPELTRELRDAVVAGCEREAGGRTIDERGASEPRRHACCAPWNGVTFSAPAGSCRGRLDRPERASVGGVLRAGAGACGTDAATDAVGDLANRRERRATRSSPTATSRRSWRQ